MTRREFLRAGALGAGAVAAGGLLPGLWSRAHAAGPKKNVLFIAIDDLRPQLSCYGMNQVLSPHIDRMAAEGFKFDRAYCQVPVCGASRASLLTGLRPTPRRFRTYKSSKQKDAPDVVSLPHQFKRNGYVTLSNGKVYHHRSDDAEAWSKEPWRPSGHWRDYRDPANIALSKRRKRKAAAAFESPDVADDDYFDGKIANRTIADLRRLKDAGKPFFLAAGFLKPHLPFNAPRRYWDLYRREDIDLAENPFRPKDGPEEAIHNWGELRAYHGIPRKGPMPDELARTLIHGYCACVSYADAQVGRVLAELDRLGLRDDTLVVLWGDHGWQLGEHGLWCKHSCFRNALRAPLLMRGPDIPAGQSTRALVEFVDLYPSLCELAGVPAAPHLEGTSVAPLLADPEREWKRAVFSRYHSGETVKTDRYAYTRYQKRGKTAGEMLYDHRTDIRENVNIAGRPEMREVVAEMQKLLQNGWRAALPPGVGTAPVSP
jgi:arylsulfatase A-like enzyme